MISVASRYIYFWRIKSECYIAFKNYSYATTFPINLIDFVKNYILSGSHYNCSEAVQTGNKCVFFSSSKERWRSKNSDHEKNQIVSTNKISVFICKAESSMFHPGFNCRMMERFKDQIQLQSLSVLENWKIEKNINHNMCYLNIFFSLKNAVSPWQVMAMIL